MTNDLKYEFRTNNNILWLSLPQVQQVLDCVIGERDTDAHTLLTMFVNDELEADKQRRISGIKEQEQRVIETLNKDLG